MVDGQLWAGWYDTNAKALSYSRLAVADVDESSNNQQNPTTVDTVWTPALPLSLDDDARGRSVFSDYDGSVWTAWLHDASGYPVYASQGTQTIV